MITFQRFTNGLYLLATDIASPAQARVGFLFQNAGRTDPTFELSELSWTDPSNQGLFAFFAPSATRDWSAFATGVRAAFGRSPGAQLAWFSEAGGSPAIVSPLVIGGQSGAPPAKPFLQSPLNVFFNNVTFNIQSAANVGVHFNDSSNSFVIGNPAQGGQSAARLLVNPPGRSAQTIFADSPAVLIPLTGPQAASLNAVFPMDTGGLADFEAGCMFFAPPAAEGQPLTALNYPIFRSAGGASTPLNVSAWLDVLAALDGTRTYFQFSDAKIGSYFAGATGEPFALATVNDPSVANTSRLVFANRPVNATSDTGTYYLTPAGQFQLGLDNSQGGSPPSASTAKLLCGVTGTEYLQVSVAVGASDVLVFVPGQAAYQQVGSSNGQPVYLSGESGNVTTSWVQILTESAMYVSQPEQSPLYQQPAGTPASVNGGAPASGLSIYLLDFLPLPAWPAGAAVTSTPVVPLAPYAGIPSTADLSPFLDLETTALNPERKNLFGAAGTAGPAAVRAAAPSVAMTPQGLLAGLSGNTWNSLAIATSPAGLVQFQNMGAALASAMQQNQIFVVISTTGGGSLFDFSGVSQQLNIADWLFNLSPDGNPSPDGTPPILILKFYSGQSIASLIQQPSLWSQPDVFNNPSGFSASQAQSYLTKLIQAACEDVYGQGNCPPGSGANPNANSLYYNFYQVVTDPNFTGVLAVNCNLQLNSLPPAIRAVLGGMTTGNPPVSDIGAFRAHHVGIQINDTDPASATPSLAQSSLFGLVDYENPAGSAAAAAGTDASYSFQVEFLRALFTNSELRQFSCQINLTINNLFDTSVSLDPNSSAAAGSAGDGANVIAITGTYQAHSTTGDTQTSGQGVYSFVAEGQFSFDFSGSPYLQNITLTKLQFSFDQETAVAGQADTTTIQSSFGIWGSMTFKQLDVLDIFSFDKLVFENLGIDVSYNLTISPPNPPSTTTPAISFSPGDLRFDLGQTTTRPSGTSLLDLLPFKLKSFLYSQTGDETVESLNYYSLSAVPGLTGVADTFTYALIFDMDLGSAGSLGSSLAAFKFSFLIGWQTGANGGVAFGVQVPEADGKLEIKIEGVLDLVIEEFKLQYATPEGGPAMLVLALHNSSLELFGKRLPPSGNIDFLLFAPTAGAQQIGWLAAFNNEPSGGGSALAAPADNGDGGVFQLLFLGGGQRVGPDPASTPTNFQDFLEFMTGDFWTAVQNNQYGEVYHPEGNWLVLSDFKLLGIVQIGFVFYDLTPFYSLTLNVENLFNFEITYTKVSDTIGLFYANFSLPDALRTFQVGAASVTLPSIAVSVYTNGNWKLDVGFPRGDDWSRCFQVQAQAGPVPVTGAGGFYIASLSSATDNIFKGTYQSIIAFGFAARLGVGKDFTSGPLKAGISVTFFGIIEGAAGYVSGGSTEIFRAPDALALQGQFGIIGQIYGSIDFKIVKASVNVTLQASIGIVLKLEPKSVPGGGDGSILLYVQASVTLSIKVEVDLGLFSVKVSFSFNASIRFQWQLAGQSSTAATLMAASARALIAAPSQIPLCPGLGSSLPLWFLPELTVVFPDTTNPGVPYFVCSLGIEYDPQPPAQPAYADFKPFEAMTAQLVTWTLTNVLGVSGCSATIQRASLKNLDQDPEALVGWITYDLLLAQLANFQAAVAVPTAAGPTQVTAFPMIPFLQLQTQGRLEGTTPADFNYQFSSRNPVSDAYLQQVEAYFNQLFVNQSSPAPPAPAGVTTPLVQEIFVEYFTGLIRGGVHELLETMYDGNLCCSPLDQLIQTAVGAQRFIPLAGQMSNSFRGGVRLPYTSGLTIPGGAPQTTTNPLYALLWQQFPAGQLSGTGTPQYTVALTNPDSTQTWVAASVNWPLTSDILNPYQNLTASGVSLPSAPTQLPFTNSGPQAFSFQNAIAWTQPRNTQASLRPFPSALQALQAAEGGSLNVLVQSRATGAPYLPGGTPLAPSDFAWGTAIQLTAAQVPGSSGGSFLPDVYALSGASQQDEILLQQILQVLAGANPIASIQILYQTSAGSTGLTSATINSADVFVLRNNTTTVSKPPSGALPALRAMAAPAAVPVGAPIDDDAGFLQIIQQAVVTNAPGYYLRYQDAAGNPLPADSFTSGPAPLTVLITYQPDGTGNTQSSPAVVQPYYNCIVLANAQAGLLYYAETTDASLSIQYPAVAAGSAGILLTRGSSSTMIAMPQPLAARCGLDAAQLRPRGEIQAALYAAGVTDESEMRRLLAGAGSASAQLNALYGLVTYQVEQGSGFIQSNLSAPVQPQQPDGGSDSEYRVFVPLYTLASANQDLAAGVPPNRYASIGDPFAAAFFLTDSFGNQIPGSLAFSGTNDYFDPLLPADQWQGIVVSYDFQVDGSPQANSFSVYLTPSAAAFQNLTPDQAAAALQLYYTIQDQLTGPGVSLFVESNLSVQADGTMICVKLSPAQTTAVRNMVSGIIAYLEAAAAGSSAPAFNVPAAAVPVTVPASTLPPLFEIAVLFGIQRDPSLISPLLKDESGNILFPSARNVATNVASTVGSSATINAFAAGLAAAFPSLVLAAGLDGAQATQQNSQAARARARLRAAGLPGDGTGSGNAGTQSLWAVQSVLLDISIPSATPQYSSPTPLDNSLNSGLVNLPQLASPLPALPAQQLFVDVDLDQLGQAFFQAVDNMLSPAAAAQAFETAPDAYTAIAEGRQQIADLYAKNEIAWLFPSGSPFTGDSTQLGVAQTTFGEQMQAALMTAYSVDTIVQSQVVWNAAIPVAVGDQVALFGQVQPADPGSQPLSQGLTLSSAQVPVVSSGNGLLTFLFGTTDAQDTAQVSLDLAFNVTHVQYFLEPANQTPPGQARPSLWLQLVNPYPNGMPHIGPAGQPTEIPVVFRQYPTPPTVLSQSGTGAPGAGNPLTAAAGWQYDFQYQVQLTPHDEIGGALTYNTNLSAASQRGGNALLSSPPAGLTLFDALARFSAANAVLQPILQNSSDPNWPAAAGAFASLVTGVVTNVTWTPATLEASGPLANITDNYVITDAAQDNGRLITLAWDAQQGESSFAGVTLAIQALGLDGQPYPGQTGGTVPNGVTDTYTPAPPLVNDWVIHQVTASHLNVLAAENALAGVQVERNVIEMTGGGTTYRANDEFIYKTPLVRPSQPVTPFVDNSIPVDIAQLPNQGGGASCPPSPSSLCQRIFTMVNNLLGDPQQVSSLQTARQSAGLDASAPRRVKMACSFQFPMPAAAGATVGANPITPSFPVVLARSFEIDGAQPDQLNDLANLYSAAIAAWSVGNGVTFGPAAQPAGAQFVFDITLYAELSSVNTPVLRLRNLQLNLTDVEPVSS